MKPTVKANNSKVASATKKNELTVSERNLLAKCRADIAKGFELVGKALGTIRDKKLYRETHRTFEQFVLEEFQMARRIAYRYIDAAKVVKNVSDGTNTTPSSESVARVLTDQKPADQKKIWDEAEKTNPNKGKKVSAKHLENTKNKMTGKDKVVKFQDRKDAMNSKAKGKTYDLKAFREELSGTIAIYRTYGLDKGGIIAELEATASILRTEKVARKAS